MEFLRKHKRLIAFLAPLSIGVFFNTNNVFSQPSAVKTEVSDPKAKALLEKVKKQYEGYSTLETKYKLEVKTAQQPKPDVQSGKMTQQGERYRMDIDKDKDFIIGDGKILWHKAGNVVQIFNAGGKSKNEFLSPKELIKLYEKKEYVSGITGERAEGWSTKATIITLKPANNRRGADFTKIEIAIDQKTNHIVSATAFDAYQSRFKVSMDTPIINQKLDASKFIFDKSKYPGIKVEDLRVD